MILLKKNSLVSLFVAALLMAGVASSGCDDSFNPIMENDSYHFTMYGALDLSVDTQWVRVMPVMDSLVSRSKTPIDAEVSLTRLSDGRRVMLNDSLFSFRNGELYAWNFWTTEPLMEGESYRLQAEASDGRISFVTVEMPLDFVPPKVEYSTTLERGRVYGGGVDRLVVADGVYFVNPIGENSEMLPLVEVFVPHIEEINYNAVEGYQFRLDDFRQIAFELQTDPGSFIIRKREVLVASGTDDWPDLIGYDEEQYVLPNLQSNVENGLGVVAGIVSKRVPMKSCYDEDGKVVPCPVIEPPY